MPKSQPIFETVDQVERAVAELRRGQPVIITQGKQKLIVASVESGQAGTRLITTAVTKKDKQKNLPKNALEKAALQLMKIAELLPACVVIAKSNTPITVTIKAITGYEDAVAYSLKEVCRAPLNLKDAGKGEIIGFRPASGGKEHYAIVVGNGLKAKAPLIRIHSSCYTGDLLGSLACDCGDQLHTALHKMGEEGGGIVLYLMQEGRGIGLVNKLRAYQLQAKGMDTVEANQSLGFEDDERLFLPAAEILKRLKIKRVRLLTNNPRKVLELERFGINVEARVPHIMQPHTHRAGYMHTKSRKLGHLLP